MTLSVYVCSRAMHVLDPKVTALRTHRMVATNCVAKKYTGMHANDLVVRHIPPELEKSA